MNKTYAKNRSKLVSIVYKDIPEYLKEPHQIGLPKQNEVYYHLFDKMQFMESRREKQFVIHRHNLNHAKAYANFLKPMIFTFTQIVENQDYYLVTLKPND